MPILPIEVNVERSVLALKQSKELAGGAFMSESDAERNRRGHYRLVGLTIIYEEKPNTLKTVHCHSIVVPWGQKLIGTFHVSKE